MGKNKKNTYNIRSFRPYPYLKKILNTDLIFIHSGSNILKLLHILTAKIFRKKIIITIHGYRNKKIYLYRMIDKYIYELADKIILVNLEILNRLPVNKNKCIIRHAFLPPKLNAEINLPEDISNWINLKKSQNNKIICANASRLDLHNNEDLYGLDMCIEVLNNLLNKGHLISFIFIVSALDRGADRFEKYQILIKKLNIENHFLLLHKKISFVKLIEKSDLVLRPTNTDGDALTIREALYLKKMVLASNIVKRPNETILFENRDINDLENKIILSFNNKIENINIKSKENIDNDYASFYIDLINNILN